MNRDLDASHQARAWTLLLLACGIVWFAVLGLRPLFNPDEGRYAEIPAEMLASGDFLVPRLNGLIYIEKPPLQYWATAATLALFGHNEFGARLFTGACAAAALCFVYLLGARAWNHTRGLAAAAMTGSMLLYVFMGQLITLDMALSCLLTIAIAAFCLAQLERTQRPDATRAWMLACWAAMAAATLTKGLIGLVIPGTVLVLYTLLQRDFQTWRHLHLGKGLALYAAIVLPWFVLVERAHPGTFDFLIIREHFQRYLTKMHDRYQPWWYFLMILALGALPWLPQVARALLLGWRQTVPAGRFDPGRVLWVSAAFTLLFFSLSDSKLAPYIVPVLPPLALLASTGGPSATVDLRRAAVLQMVLGSAVAIALPLYARKSLSGDAAWTFATLTPWLWAVAAILLLGGTAALLQQRRSLAAAARTLAVTGFVVALTLIVGGAGAISARYTGKNLLARAGPLTDGAPIYTVDTFDWTLPFYTRHAAIPVQWRGELDYGLGLEPAKGIATVDQWTPRWQADTAAYALMPHKMYERLAQAGLPMRVLAEDFENVLVSRR